MGPIFVVHLGLPLPTASAATMPSRPERVWLHAPRFMKLAKTVWSCTAGEAAVQRCVANVHARLPVRVLSAKSVPGLFEK